MICGYEKSEFALVYLWISPVSKRMTRVGILGLVYLAVSTAVACADWPAWRGPLGTGTAPDANPPITWSETENVRWKTALPGKGHSTPVVSGSRLFVTAAEPVGGPFAPRYSGAPGAHDNVPVTHEHRFLVLAIDRQTGQLIWNREVNRLIPHEGGHNTASQASASPVTDGQRVFASFGSHGLYCLDFQGEVLWRKDLGRLHTKHGHGEGSSPALGNGTLIVNGDHERASFLVALDASSGNERWRVTRDELTSWSSPIVVQHAGQWQAIVCGTNRIRGYRLEDGAVLWECGGLSANVVATPIYWQGMVFAASSYETRAMLAIDLQGATGDLTDTDHVVWSRTHGTPYVPSPLLYDGALYFLRHYQGILTRVDAKTGSELGGPLRLGHIRNVFASPLAAADRGLRHRSGRHDPSHQPRPVSARVGRQSAG